MRATQELVLGLALASAVREGRPMGWFDRKPRWDGKVVLERAAQLAGMFEPIVTNQTLEGVLKDVTLRVALGEEGAVQRIALAYSSKLDSLVLVRDVEDPDSEPERRIEVGPEVFVTGPHADRQAAAFRALPESLQQRVVDDMRRLDITELASHRKQLVIVTDAQLKQVPEPARWLSDAISLGADVARDRGARAPDGPPMPGLAEKLAPKLAARIPGSAIVKRDDGLAITWSDASIVLAGNELSIEVRGEYRDELLDFVALHELGALTTGGGLVSVGVCDLDDITDDGAAAYRIAGELVNLMRSPR